MKFKINSGLVGLLAFIGLCGFTVDRVPRLFPPGRRVAASASVQGPQDDLEAMARDVVGTYVEVQTERGYGSGTVIQVGTEKLVLTAGHVVKGFETVRLYKELDDGRKIEMPAEVVRYSAPEEDGGMDLALLKPEKPELLTVARYYVPGCDPREAKPQVGETAWYCGSGGKIRANLNRTIINRSGYQPEGVRTPFMLVNGNGYFGHSGSGVFVKRGPYYVLVGVVLRILGDYPKSPVLCRQPGDVRAFIQEYLDRGEEEEEDCYRE